MSSKVLQYRCYYFASGYNGHMSIQTIRRIYENYIQSKIDRKRQAAEMADTMLRILNSGAEASIHPYTINPVGKPPMEAFNKSFIKASSDREPIRSSV